jgi:hypothetical protein
VRSGSRQRPHRARLPCTASALRRARTEETSLHSVQTTRKFTPFVAASVNFRLLLLTQSGLDVFHSRRCDEIHRLTYLPVDTGSFWGLVLRWFVWGSCLSRVSGSPGVFLHPTNPTTARAEHQPPCRSIEDPSRTEGGLTMLDAMGRYH